MKILLVEPDYPIPQKSKNHKNFLPIGLLKIASYLRSKGGKVNLVRGIPKNLSFLDILSFEPDEIWVTSLFTYWSKYVKDTVENYRSVFPNAKIKVGGIYASLMPEHCKEFTGCDEVHIGIIKEAERFFPAYDLVKNENPSQIDYQIIHASRGCIRRCPFCGTWKIEPEFEPKRSIKNEIKYKKLVFYDNNFLANPYVENILTELIDLKREKEIQWCESQSGFDGRILIEKPHLAKMLKEAGFRYPRIAWDWEFDKKNEIKEEINILLKAGYKSKDIYAFMLYNWKIPFKEMEMKRIKCWQWKVQIADCRYRPLTQTYDFFNSHEKSQSKDDYYIYKQSGWSDSLVKQFRKNIRRQNICVRHGFPFYSKKFERKSFDKKTMNYVKNLKNLNAKKHYLDKLGADYWFPS